MPKKAVGPVVYDVFSVALSSIAIPLSNCFVTFSSQVNVFCDIDASAVLDADKNFETTSGGYENPVPPIGVK